MSVNGVPVPGIHPADALQILPPGVDRQSWLAERRTGIGGSDVSALVGLSRWTSRVELWEDKTGRLPLVDEASEEAEMGTLLEPVVRDRFARVHQVRVDLCGMLRSQRWPWMLANPDGLITDKRVGYEGKTCTIWKAHEWGDPDNPLVPDHAELQAQWCMAVTGWDAWWVACLIGGQRNVYRHVERDDELIGDLVEISREFWNRNVLDDAEPDVDGSRGCADFLKARYPAADEDKTAEVDPHTRDDLVVTRDKALAAEKAAKSDNEAVKNRVRSLMGTAGRLACGDQEIATWLPTDRFAEKRFRAEHPDLVAQYTHPVPALDVEALRADHPDIHAAYRVRALRFTD